MGFKGFYRHIIKNGDKYRIKKGNEFFLECKSLEEALYERDRFENVDWNWDLYVQLPDTINGYIHITLPPFTHQPSYITEESEHWMVREKGADLRYRGTYSSFEDARKVAIMYNANITHKPKTYAVKKNINGKRKFYGRYKTREEAEERVKQLEECDWNDKST